jgi:hypothetical protein
MIRRKLLIATAVIASVVITACSDMAAPRNDPGALPAAAILAAHPVAAKPAAVVATINGGGTAEMQPPGLAVGRTLFGMGVKLLADGSATGDFDCVDQGGGRSNFPGNIFGEVTGWSMEGTVVVLNVIGKLVSFPGGDPVDVSFTVKIQQFGGAGVGRWTLAVGGVIFCVELLTSGQIVYRPA